jgi:hypothetical protein
MREEVTVQSIDQELTWDLGSVVTVDVLRWPEFIGRVVNLFRIDVSSGSNLMSE